MCLPMSRGPPPATRGKSPPSSSSSSSGSSSDDAPPVSSRRHRRRNTHSTSTESDLPSSRIVAGNARSQQGSRYSAPPSRKPSSRKPSRASSVVGGGSVAGSVPSRRPSTRASRDAARLAPGSPQMGTPRSPAFSAKSEKPSRSPSKKQHPLTASNSTSRRKILETPIIQQTPGATPRAPPPAALSGKKEKRKTSSEMDVRDSIIALKAPLRDGGMVSGLMVIRPGSSKRDSESGSSRSKSSSRKSESGDRRRERPGSGGSSGISKASTLVPIGLGISLEGSRAPTPTSKAKVERVWEIESRHSQIPTISIAAPTPEKPTPKSAPRAVPRLQVQPPPPPAPAPAPKLPVVNVSPPTPSVTYPIMATLVYPTKDQLAYQPISRYQVTTNVTPSKVYPPPPATIRHAAPPLAARAAPAVHPPPTPPALQQYQDPFNSSPASSIHGVPLQSGGSPPLSQQSSISSISVASLSSSSASGSTVSIAIEQEQPTPITRQISYTPNAAASPGSSTSSLVTASSSTSGSATGFSNYFRTGPPRAPTPDVNVPELSSRKPSYYRYSAPQDTTPKPVKTIMDSPNPTVKRAGPWDGMPGADPNLGAYYRNAAAAKRRETTTTKPAPSTPVKPKDTSVDAANIAAYYRQAEVQKRKLALERMKHEQSETEDETSASEISSASKPWVDPNLAGYYRAAEAAKKKQEPTVKKATPSANKALIPSPVKEPVKGIAGGRSIFFSSIRRSIPAMFHSAPHSPHVPFAPPPAPTPPPGEGVGSTIGEGDGPPEGAAESWFKKANMAAPDDGRQEASEYWTSPSETTLPGAGAEGEAEFPSTVPPPAPTPPLVREQAVPPASGYYARSPRAGYSYRG